jgi:hypothetical protein
MLYFQTIVITNINTTASTFRGCFGQIGIGQLDWKVGFPHSTGIPHKPSAQSVSVPSSDVHCSRGFFNETIFKPLNVFYALKRVCILLIISFYSSYALKGYFIYLMLSFQTLSGAHMLCFTLKRDVHYALWLSVNHEN